MRLDNLYDTEIKNRISSAWGGFMANREELCNKRFPLQARVQLFEAVVTQRVLYASGCWTMNLQLERLLMTTRRKMLRMMCPRHLRQDDSWAENFSKWTHSLEALFEKHGSHDWNQRQRKQKRKLAAKTAKADVDRWSSKLLNLKPAYGRGRDVGRPRRRWDFDIEAVAGGNWQEHARHDDLWRILQQGYAESM